MSSLTMKKQFLLIVALVLTTLAAGAADLTGKRIYINPGHGSFGPNDRPMATIPYPNLAATGMPDTCGFYETNTNLWKCLELGRKLAEAGATVDYSRTANGPMSILIPIILMRLIRHCPTTKSTIVISPRYVPKWKPATTTILSPFTPMLLLRVLLLTIL